MGFVFRRSIRLGPLRLNFSRRGVGASIGVRGFRTGVSSTGRRYTRVSLPGTGLGYEHTHARATEEAPSPAEARPATPSSRESTEGPTLGWVTLVLLAVGLYYWLSA